MSTESRRALEAILMVSDQPIEPQLLAQLLELSPARVEELCAELATEYERDERGFVLARVAGGYRFQTHAAPAPYVERFVLEGQTARLSAAALETLAIVAYKQPISRAQIASVRGVDPDGVLRTLQARGYVDQVARDPGPGNATLWGTTALFLEKLGLNSLADLPPLAEYVPGPDVVEALEHGLRVEPASLNGHANGTHAVAADDALDLDDDGAPGGGPLATGTATTPPGVVEREREAEDAIASERNAEATAGREVDPESAAARRAVVEATAGREAVAEADEVTVAEGVSDVMPGIVADATSHVAVAGGEAGVGVTVADGGPDVESELVADAPGDADVPVPEAA